MSRKSYTEPTTMPNHEIKAHILLNNIFTIVVSGDNPGLTPDEKLNAILDLYQRFGHNI